MGKRNSNLKIAIIGPYPPPYGGISIHVQRMHYFLQQERNIKHIVYTETDVEKADLFDIRRDKKWLLKYFFTAKENILHFHDISWKKRVLIGFMGFFGKKVVLTIHGESLNNQINQSNWIEKRLLVWALKNINIIIVVKANTKSFIMGLGVKNEKIEFIPTFIPPTVRDEDFAEIPQEVWTFIKRHSPIISANAFKIVFYNNEDLYGIDMCIELCDSLKSKYPKVGFIFCLPDIGDYDYFNKMKQRIKNKGIESNFLFQTKPCQMYPIIMKSDVFVRPTNTDGYGISVAEAIYFKIPAVASDVCMRTESTILFKNRDINEFILKVKMVLNNYEHYKNKLCGIELKDNVRKILKIYQKIAGR